MLIQLGFISTALMESPQRAESKLTRHQNTRISFGSSLDGDRAQ